MGFLLEEYSGFRQEGDEKKQTEKTIAWDIVLVVPRLPHTGVEKNAGPCGF
jgi:hypothetical protein